MISANAKNDLKIAITNALISHHDARRFL